MESNENRQVLNLVQAMLGSISPNVRAVSLVATEAAVILRFLLERDRAEDRETIQDVVFEFEALQSSNLDVNVEISVSADPFGKLEVPGRVVYLRKERLSDPG